MDVIAEATVAYPFIFVLSILRGVELVFGKFLLSGIGLQSVVIENVHATIILLNLYIWDLGWMGLTCLGYREKILIVRDGYYKMWSRLEACQHVCFSTIYRNMNSLLKYLKIFWRLRFILEKNSIVCNLLRLNRLWFDLYSESNLSLSLS